MKSIYRIIEEGIKEYEFEEWDRIEAASIEEMMEECYPDYKEAKKMNDKDEIKEYLLRDINEIFEKEDVDNVYMHREGDEYTIKIYVNEFED